MSSPLQAPLYNWSPLPRHVPPVCEESVLDTFAQNGPDNQALIRQAINQIVPFILGAFTQNPPGLTQGTVAPMVPSQRIVYHHPPDAGKKYRVPSCEVCYRSGKITQIKSTVEGGTRGWCPECSKVQEVTSVEVLVQA